MSDGIERDVHNIERAAEAVLREHPDALVCGLSGQGLIAPVPESVGLWGQGAIEGRAVTDVVIAEDRMTVVDAWRRVLQDGVAEGRVRLLSKPASWVTLRFLDLRPNHGVLLCVLLSSEEAGQQDTDSQLDESLSVPPRLCVITETELGIVLDIDDAFTRMFGYTAEDVIGRPILDQVHPDDAPASVERWVAMLSTRRAQRCRQRRRHKDGHYVWTEMTFHNYLNHPDRNYVLVEMLDVSAETAARDALQEKGELLRRLLEETPDGLLQVDNEKTVVYHNARMLEILHGDLNANASSIASSNGHKSGPGSGMARSLRELLSALSEESMASFDAALDRALKEGVDGDVEVDVAIRAGGWRRVFIGIRMLERAEGEVSGAVIRALDITELTRGRREVEQRATSDPLTRLQRRSSILAAIQAELDREDSSCTGVIYIDLDDLGSVNEALGHAAGDELLVLVAERLRAASRENDRIGRLGGDEFLVLLPEIPAPDVAMRVAQRIEASLGAGGELSCGTVDMSASVGVAYASGGSVRAEELVKRARRAMQRSEERGRRDHGPVLRPRGGRRKGAGIPRLGWLRRPARTGPSTNTQTEARACAAPTQDEVQRRFAQHTRQHDAVAHLSRLALREHDQGALLDEVVATVARTLGIDLCTVLRLREDAEALDMIATVGYSHGPCTVPAGASTQSGYTIRTRSPVVATDLRDEARFDPKLLLQQGMLSGMTAVIEGHERPFGVIGAHSSERRDFDRDDVNFLVAIANVVSAALERKREEDSARHAALHDHLTGFPNRTLALDRIDRALARRRRDGTEVAVLLLDIDRFKVINDSLGHDAGDEVLLALARRLEEALRTSDTIAHPSGDEFLLISEHPDGPRYAVELAERLGDAVRQPLELSGDELHLSASIGIALAAGSDDTAASLLRDADAAMHRAKEAGRGRYELFDETVRARVVSRLRTETELRHALERQQLEVHYQPIIDASSGEPVAAEALVRWKHPHHGLVPPLEFIPIAEETGLIGALGRYVLEQACAQGAAWQERYSTPLRIYVNVSGHQLADVEFPGQAVEIARRSGLLHDTLSLEVTETVLIEEAKSSIDVLSELDAHGLPLVLDDFGTGYSGLSYLRRFPLSAVKVDRSFVDGIDTSRVDLAILKGIVAMCRELGLAVVGEGVETDAQLHHLRKLGCAQIQGYLLCRPMPVEETTAFLDRRFSPGALDDAA